MSRDPWADAQDVNVMLIQKEGKVSNAGDSLDRFLKDLSAEGPQYKKEFARMLSEIVSDRPQGQGEEFSVLEKIGLANVHVESDGSIGFQSPTD